MLGYEDKGKEEMLELLKKLYEENKQLKKRKKYGLVWEEHEEELDIRGTIPLLKGDKGLSLPKVEGKPNNYLIEGDNYHALKALQHTHKGKIDVIYIDPPYNTGNRDFVYNDSFVDREDGFRHSKWLSFMEKRLRLARELLSDEGVIFVSIDDNEQAQLKLLMDSIFGEYSFVSKMVWKQKSGGSNDSRGIVNETEYIFVYSKKEGVFFNQKAVNMEIFNLKDEYFTERGYYVLEKLDRSSLGYLESLDFPIYSKEYGENAYAGGSVEKNKILKARWRWGKEKVEWGLENGFIVIKKNKDGELSVYTKRYQKVDNNNKPVKRTNPYRNYIDFVNTTAGNREIKEIFNNSVPFNYAKPTELIKHLLRTAPKQEGAIILDFFAGSGTTGHAVLELNKEDGGNRSFILCTNNEVSEEVERKYLYDKGIISKNNKTEFNKYKKEYSDDYIDFITSDEYQELGISRAVTRERVKRVIEGYKTPKGREVEGLGGNLEYLRTYEFEDMELVGMARTRIAKIALDSHYLKYPKEEYETVQVDRFFDVRDNVGLDEGKKKVFYIIARELETKNMYIEELREFYGEDIIVETFENYYSK